MWDGSSSGLFFCLVQTRVFVTNSITYLSKMDHIVVLRHGRISEQGSYHELLQQNGAFAEFISNYLAEDHSDDDKDEDSESNPVSRTWRRLWLHAFHYGDPQASL